MTPEPVTAQYEPKSSVELTRNSRGWAYSVKMYSGDTDLRPVLDALVRTVSELEATYPRDGHEPVA